VDRHANLEFFVAFDFLKIDVEIFIRDGVPLHFLKEGKRLVGLVAALELNKHRAIANGFEQAGKLRAFNGE